MQVVGEESMLVKDKPEPRLQLLVSSRERPGLPERTLWLRSCTTYAM